MNAPQRLQSRTSRRIFVRDLKIPAMIGVYDFEKDAHQLVCINVDLTTDDKGAPLDDDFNNTVSYETTVIGIKNIIAAGHINLVETLADKIAEFCLSDARVHSVKVNVEKPDIIPEAAGVGVEIERYQTLRLDLPDAG